MQKTAGNIPYQRLIYSQGENYKVKISLSKIPKLYAYGFFFSARLLSDGAMVTIKEKDKYWLQMALGIDNIQILEKHNRYYKPKSDYAEMKKRAEYLGSKIEYIMIEPEQLELLKNETDRFIKSHVGEKIRLVFPYSMHFIPTNIPIKTTSWEHQTQKSRLNSKRIYFYNNLICTDLLRKIRLINQKKSHLLLSISLNEPKILPIRMKMYKNPLQPTYQDAEDDVLHSITCITLYITYFRTIDR